MRKLISALLMLAMAFALLPGAMSEEELFPQYITDNGGGTLERDTSAISCPAHVFFTSPVSPRALLDELEIVYMEASEPYLMIGETATWTIHAAGGDGNYEYSYALYYRSPSNSKGTDESRYILTARSATTASDRYSYRVTKAGRYILIVHLIDSQGQSMTWQSQAFETAEADDYNDPETVAGKVKALAEQCRREAGASQQAQAVWAHDWLIYNADYDYDYSYYFADGVLLHGTGVCNSYALAYQLLMDELGIECRYVMGYYGTTAHAWNIVKINGNWYQVDCTWDDGSSGESHEYCLVSDDVMAVKHTWSNTAYIPACDALDMNYYVSRGARVANDAQQVEEQLSEAVQNGEEYVNLYSADVSFSLYNSAVSCVSQLYKQGRIASYSIRKSAGWHVFIWMKQSGQAPDPIVIECGRKYNVADKAPAFDFTWSSGNDQVAAVTEDGVICGTGAGTTTITGKQGTISYSVQCTVVGIGNVQMVLPENLTEIEARAFENCMGITGISISGNRCVSIGSRAFAGCSDLEYIIIPDSVTVIADDAFDTNAQTVICCRAGSYAQRYAVDHNMPCLLIDEN